MFSLSFLRSDILGECEVEGGGELFKLFGLLLVPRVIFYKVLRDSEHYHVFSYKVHIDQAPTISMLVTL